MTKPLKVITAPVKLKGDFGGVFPTAIVAFYSFSKLSQETMAAAEGANNYAPPKNDVQEITYSVSFWFNAETKAAGFKPRPIENEAEEDEEYKFVFTVDANDPRYANILNQPGDAWDRIMQVADMHYRQEVMK